MRTNCLQPEPCISSPPTTHGCCRTETAGAIIRRRPPWSSSLVAVRASSSLLRQLAAGRRRRPGHEEAPSHPQLSMSQLLQMGMGLPPFPVAVHDHRTPAQLVPPSCGNHSTRVALAVYGVPSGPRSRNMRRRREYIHILIYLPDLSWPASWTTVPVKFAVYTAVA